MQRFRRATWKTWLGGALVAWLLLAESFAITHEYDLKSHANGQACAVCVAAASFGAADVAAPLGLEPAVATPHSAVAAPIVFVSVVPARRYARGPPRISFSF